MNVFKQFWLSYFFANSTDSLLRVGTILRGTLSLRVSELVSSPTLQQGLVQIVGPRNWKVNDWTVRRNIRPKYLHFASPTQSLESWRQSFRTAIIWTDQAMNQESRTCVLFILNAFVKTGFDVF